MRPLATPEHDLRAAWVAFRHEAQTLVDAFRLSHADPQAVQRARLAAILSDATDTPFGREHGFASVDRYETYIERVPPMNWSDFQPWIDKACTADSAALSAERPLFFEATSGSSAARKLIPYTKPLLQEFQRAIIVWLATLYDDCPDVASGRSYWALSPPMPAHAPTANGTAVGGAGDAAYLAGSCAMPLLNGVLTPANLSAEPDQWRAATLAAMINAPDLRMISVWSPTFLIALLQPIVTSDEAADALHQYLDQRQRVALNRALTRGDFSELWPDLAVISCWMDGPSQRYVALLRDWFPHARFAPKGLLATEGVVSISQGLTGLCPLALDSHVLEFVDSNEQCVLADALIPGERYQPLLTTSGGLYRYALGDVIEYAGEHDGLRCIRFIGRADARSDLAGEKLDESLASNACDAFGEAGATAVLVPLSQQATAGYALLIDGVTAEVAATLANRVDEQLMTAHHYALARNIGQLAALEAIVVRDVAELMRTAWQSMGGRLGDLKPARLVVSLPFAHAIMAQFSKQDRC